VEYIHKQGVVHRDLKLENILVDDDFDFHLADFGFATMGIDEKGRQKKLNDFLGAIKSEILSLQVQSLTLRRRCSWETPTWAFRQMCSNSEFACSFLSLVANRFRRPIQKMIGSIA
jgi:serine/threonine protein kinase